jgi:amino-acid N-acetyltransferase
VRVREARPTDVAAILELLSQCKLPLDGVPGDADLLLVADQAGRIAGVAGLERHGADGLLRSVATAPESRGRGCAGALCEAVESHARASGLRRLYLLTETAELFFAKRGYSRIERAQAPPGVAGSREFSAVCPTSAALLVRELG